MKKIITNLIFTLFIINVFAQQPTLNKIDSMLVDIDKSTLTTNVLYERVFPFAKLTVFNDSLNVSNSKHFEQALSELHKASNKQKFTSHKQLRTHYSSIGNDSVVDIGIINALFYQLNYIEEDQQESALKITNNKFEKNSNDKPIFIPKNVLIISPLKEYLVGDAITYHFNNAFLVEDNNKTISSIIANFDTPNDYTIYNNAAFTNTNLTINYNDTGYKTLTFLVTYNDGTTQATQAMVHIKRSPLSDPPARWSSLNTTVTNAIDFEFQGSHENTAINGEIEYRIWYANTGNTGTDLSIIQKPIIIVDGFDPLDKRKIIDEDSNKPAGDHTSIEELMVYPVIGQNEPEKIIEKLNLEGYDVIIVNHPFYTANGRTIDGGADYIERNGLTHASFYQEINRNLALNGSSEELVIMGPSMGGLISRYALAYMEKKEVETGMSIWNHNTRLWVSIDSPHLGANIPMGVQSLLYTLKNVADSVEAADFVDDELNSNAAKEMLIEQYKQKYIDLIWGTFPHSSGDLLTEYLNAKTVSQGFSEDRGRPEFISFYNRLNNNGITNSKGFPMNLRKVAIVNGSLTGSKSYYNPYNNGNLDNFSGDGNQTIKIKGFEDDFFDMHLVTMESYAMPSPNSRHKISYFKKKKAIGWRYTDTYITNINSRGSLDNVPGGWFKSLNDVVEEITGVHIYSNLIGAGPSHDMWWNWGISVDKWTIPTLKNVASFIPTVSALAIKNPDFNWNNVVGDRNLKCTEETRFDNYYGEVNNTNHVSFTQGSKDWLFQELEAGTNGPFPNPSVFLKGDDLIGEDTICYNEINTYYFNDCKAPGAATWQLSQSLVEIASTDNSITVKSISPNAYQHWIKANFQNNTPAIKNIHGKPNVTYRVTNSVPNRPIITLTGIEPSYTVVWEQTGGNGTLYDAGFGDSIRAASGSQANWVVEGVVHITSRCGTSNMQFIIHGPDNPCGDLYLTKTGNNTYQAKTNPNEDPYNPCGEVNINNAELYSAYGIKEQDLTPLNNEINLDNAQSGTIKIIKVVVDNKVLTKRVIVD